MAVKVSSPNHWMPGNSRPLAHLFFTVAPNSLNFSLHLVLRTAQGPPQQNHPRYPYTRTLPFYLPHLQQGCTSWIFPSSAVSRPPTRSEIVLLPQQKSCPIPLQALCPTSFSSLWNWVLGGCWEPYGLVPTSICLIVYLPVPGCRVHRRAEQSCVATYFPRAAGRDRVSREGMEERVTRFCRSWLSW